jgi:hypothetical protein
VNWLKKPSTTGGIIYLVVVAATVFGLGIVVAGEWRVGVLVMSAAFGFACLSRAVLPDERAGMLRVRRRFVDITVLLMCSGGLFVLAAIIPWRR